LGSGLGSEELPPCQDSRYLGRGAGQSSSFWGAAYPAAGCCGHFNDASTESSDSKDVLSMKSNGSRPNKENMATQ